MSGPVIAGETAEAVIREMLEAAGDNGLEDEVVMAFAKYVKQGDTIPRAAWCALYDWDCVL